MVVTTILESKDLSSFSTDELISYVVTHETRLHLTDESISNSFKTQFSFSRGRGRGRSRGRQGRGSNQSNPHSSGGNKQQYPNQNFQGQRQQQQNEHQNFQPQRGRGRRSNEKKAYNAITAKSMGTMNLNAGRNRQINSQAEHMCQITREKNQEVCFFRATRLKNNLKISGCWTVDATIT
jgi:hypothetical protein